jgi:proline racemase
MRVSTLDAHVAGGAVRLLTSGLPSLEGDTMAERRSSFEARAGTIADALSREPRGHAGVVGVVLTEPERPDADCGMVFFAGEGPRRLSGHAAMAAGALAVSRGLISPRVTGQLDVDTEAGPLHLEVGGHGEPWPRLARLVGPRAIAVRGAARVTTTRRALSVDIAWSGSELVAVVDGESAGVPLSAAHTLELRRGGREVLDAIAETVRVARPGEGSPGEVTGCVFVGPPSDDHADVRAVMVREDGSVSRTASASASSALAVVLAAMGVSATGRPTRHENLAGVSWTVELVEQDGNGQWRIAIASDVYLTGEHVFDLHSGDPLLRGVAWR